MAQITCPSCGSAIEVPEKKSKAPWLIGCLVAAAVIPVFLGVIGLLAAIAIPSFVKARNTAQMNGCVNNMRMIDAGKEQWALASRVDAGKPADVDGVNQYLINSTTPVCPAGGDYTYNNIGADPECSLHGPLSSPHDGMYRGEAM